MLPSCRGQGSSRKDATFHRGESGQYVIYGMGESIDVNSGQPIRVCTPLVVVVFHKVCTAGAPYLSSFCKLFNLIIATYCNLGSRALIILENWNVCMMKMKKGNNLICSAARTAILVYRYASSKSYKDLLSSDNALASRLKHHRFITIKNTSRLKNCWLAVLADL